MARPYYTIRPYRHPRYKFVVNGKEAGLRARKFFETEAAAKTYVEQKAIELLNGGREAMEFPSRLRVMAQQATEILNPYEKTIMDAVRFYLPHLKAQATVRPVPKIVAEFLKIKKKDGASPRYMIDLRSRLGNFARAHPDRHIADFTGAQIDDWLRSLPHGPTNRNNFKRILGVFFSYAVARGYLSANPAHQATIVKVAPVRPGILNVEQARRLLQSASDEIVPAILLGLFAGLRPEAEVCRLDWSNIDLDERLIDITKSKNLASDRFVTISDNLAAWLKLYLQASGPICRGTSSYHHLLQQARAAATASAEEDEKPSEGIADWPQDCLRHTFASMHYAMHKSAGETAMQLGHGHNLRTFMRHYKNRVKPAEAERFWAIFPA